MIRTKIGVRAADCFDGFKRFVQRYNKVETSICTVGTRALQYLLVCDSHGSKVSSHKSDNDSQKELDPWIRF